MNRGRPASLPDTGHSRPPVRRGLLVTHTNEKGDARRTYDFGLLPVSPEMRLELAQLFEAKVRPTGTWRNLPTSKQGWESMLLFTRWLAEQDRAPSRLGEIDAATWMRWRLSRPDTKGARASMRSVARILRASVNVPDTTKREMARRVQSPQTDETAYSDDELRRITVAARRIFRQAERRIRTNQAHLAAYRAGEFEPGSDANLLGELLEHVERNGDVPVSAQVRRVSTRYVSSSHLRVLGSASAEHTWKRLFLDRTEITAVMVLIAVQEGWNFTSILELPVPTRSPDPGGVLVYRIELEKRRRERPNRYETRTIIDSGPQSSGRLFTRVLRVTEPARTLRAAHGRPVTNLLAYRVSGSSRTVDPVDLISDRRSPNIDAEQRALFGDGLLNFRRIRKTINVRRLREPNQNTRATHDSVYVLRDPHTHGENEPLIAKGVEGAVRHANKIVAAVRETNEEIGDETAISTCIDLTSSPFSPWGVPCEASFLLCLACANAVVMPLHLGKLAYLHECLSELRGSMPSDRWVATWARHYDRLNDLRSEYYSNAQWEQALASLSAPDRQIVDRLMNGDLDS